MTLKAFGIVTGVAIALAVFGFIPGMGLPGAIVFAAFALVAELVYGRGIINRLSDDAIWPIAIFMTWLWPISIPVGWLVGWGAFGHFPRAAKILAMGAVMALWGLGLTLYFVSVAPKKGS
jgi:hypothetical protein